jgi:hypothetical protein
MSQSMSPTGTLRVLLLVAVIFMVPCIVEGAALSVNGICEVGDCASPDVLSVGGSASFDVSFVYTFANGDEYRIYGGFTASEPVLNETLFNELSVNGVTYIGNSTGGAVPSGTDTLLIDQLQGYTINYTSNTFFNAGPGYTSPPMGGGIAAGSSYEQQSFYEGQGLPALGPYTVPGTPEAFSGTTLSGLENPLMFDLHFTETFEAGSPVGSFIGSPIPEIPEPSGMVFVLAGGLLLVFRYKMRSRRSAA